MDDDPDALISILKRLSRHCVSSEADVARLAERVLQALVDDPSLLDGPDMDRALLLLVDRIAKEGQ
jgi:hypothetical protein